VKSETWSFCPETCAASGFAALEPECADGIIVANNPINWTDPTGEKTCIYTFSGGRVPTHAYIKITNSKVGTYTAGFHPLGGWQMGILTYQNKDTWVLGEVRHDETGGMAVYCTGDDCSDDKFIKAIDAVTKENHAYSFYRFNCWHWISRVFSESGKQ